MQGGNGCAARVTPVAELEAGASPFFNSPFFNLHAGLRRPTMREMFDTIKAELATAADKLTHLRRFL